MSNTNARASFPSLIAFSSVGSSGTFVTAAGITKITPPKYTRGFVDITDMNSTDYYEDSALAGPIRTGTMGFVANYLSTNDQQKTILKEAFENGDRIGWKITLGGAASYNIWYGDGIVSAYSMSDLTMDGKVEITFELKTKGKPTGPVSSTT